MATPQTVPRTIGSLGDDVVITFRTELSRISGRLVRLGAVADTILARHKIPEQALAELGEALSLSALLGSALPGEGKIIVQTSTDGPVTFLVADYEAPGRIRGYARFNKDKMSASAAAEPKPTGQTRLLGAGHLAITIETGPTAERYQGVVALDGGPLADGAERYFEQSEALPTFVRLAVARLFQSGAGTPASSWHWRGGGIMLQHVQGTQDDDEAAKPGHSPPGPRGETDEDWVRVRSLAETIEDHELLDPTLTPERLLLRLFHEEGVVILNAQPLEAYCRCSRDRVFNVLQSFGATELSDMHDDNGAITATCEFCTTTYVFDPSEFSDASVKPE